MKTLQKFEIFVSGLIVLICLVFLWESRTLPPGTFEPLGSGPVPQVTAALIIICCFVVIVAAWKKKGGVDVPADDAPQVTVGAACLMIITTLLFVIALQQRVIGFGWMATVFLTLTIWGLEKFQRRKLIPALLAGLFVGFAMEYLFTKVFFVDLPT